MSGIEGTIEYDVAVVGLGALGSAAAWQLARRGATVAGFERFPLGHEQGASHGDSRIIRLSYHTEGYVRSAAEAFDEWASLEAECGQRLITPVGGADVFPPGAAIDVADYTTAMDAAGVAYELLDAAGSTARWPGLVVPDGAVVLHQARTGIVAAAPSVAALQRQARAHGAHLRDRCPVVSVRPVPEGVLVITADGGTVRAAKAVVATDAWVGQLLPRAVPVVTTQEYVMHYEVPHRSHRPGDFPVWIWMDDPSYYGFPAYGDDTVKVGQDCGGHEVDPDHRPTTDDLEYLARMQAFVQRVVPGAGPARRTTRCLYTLTPDRDFVLGPLPGHEQVLVALGAAHGFKFAAWFGAVLADLALTGRTTSEVGAFALDRPALEPATAGEQRRWLV